MLLLLLIPKFFQLRREKKNPSLKPNDFVGKMLRMRVYIAIIAAIICIVGGAIGPCVR